MKQSKRTVRKISKALPGLAVGLILALIGNNTAQAYESYDAGCSASSCHGVFDGSTSPKGTVFPSDSKHEMHRANSNMNTDCDLCHTAPSRQPVYTSSSNGTANNSGLGCSGCHVGPGLRKHHAANGVTACYSGGSGCHGSGPETAPPENVKPPYYGTLDTKVKNPGNTALVANTNENWSVGDFLGLDNDGNNLYDLADYAVGPRDRILSSTREGNNIRVTWQTYGGRTNTVQAAGNVSGAYSGISPAITSTNVGPITTNYLDVGGALTPRRFYRLSAQLP